ncbi:hypothetical protein LSH36_1206g00050, partial [Paralvinella palmiformis]
VPKERRCDYLTGLTFGYHLSGNTSWVSINADLSVNTVIISFRDPGMYIMQMTAINNQEITSESGSQCVVIKGKLSDVLWLRLMKKPHLLELQTFHSQSVFIASDGSIINGVGADNFTQQGNENSSGFAYIEDENPDINSVIPIADFESYVNRKNISDEFKTLPASDNTKCEVAIKSENSKKNRFDNIYPYDYNRVTLIKDDSNTDTDYTNACFIKGYGDSEKTYIAAQGVKPETVGDFWKMIWQYHINSIVMLVNTVEENKESSPRPIYHFQFRSWTEKGGLLYGPSTLLHFHKRVHLFDSQRTGPLVVHCGTGVGRTGTFIALDILLQQIVQEKGVNVYGCVKTLRQQRMQMVQIQGQYVLLHDTILESIIVGKTSYSCSTLSDELKNI